MFCILSFLGGYEEKNEGLMLILSFEESFVENFLIVSGGNFMIIVKLRKEYFFVFLVLIIIG